jgi:hypothetical protein
MFIYSRILATTFAFLLMSIGAYGAAPIEYHKEEHPPKLEGVLSRIHKDWVRQKRALAKTTILQYGATIFNGEYIKVIVEPEPEQLAETIDFNGIQSLGGRVVSQSRHLVQISIPISSLKALTQIRGVQFVRLPLKPKSNAVISEGVGKVNAPSYIAKGFTGRGIKVGVIDLGFEGVPDLQARGELPQLQYRDFTGEGIFTTTVHGAACAEIVYDIAPEAQIYLYKVSSGLDLENAKDAAIEAGIDIVILATSTPQSWRSAADLFPTWDKRMTIYATINDEGSWYHEFRRAYAAVCSFSETLKNIGGVSCF